MAFDLEVNKNANSSRVLLRVHRYRRDDGAHDVRKAAISNMLRVRVEWDGTSGSLGTFAVLNLNGEWEACDHLSSEASANDLILGKPLDEEAGFTVSIERGPSNSDIPFEAWVYPISWKIALPEYDRMPHDMTVHRGDDYIRSTEKPSIHEYSTSSEGGQRLLLELESEFYYELWVKLRHPTQQDVWCIQDPIIDPGNSAGSGTDPTNKSYTEAVSIPATNMSAAGTPADGTVAASELMPGMMTPRASAPEVTVASTAESDAAVANVAESESLTSDSPPPDA